MSQRGSSKRAVPAFKPKIVGARLLGVAGVAVRAAARKPGTVLVSAAVIGGASLFAWNATMQQQARHPAPLFVAPKTTASIKVEPPRRPEFTSAITPAPGSARQDPPAQPVRTASSDPIGGLLKATEGGSKSAKAGEVKASPKAIEAKPAPKAPEVKAAAKASEAKLAEAKAVEAKGSEGKPVVQPRVTSAQKALAKLGYGPITADGILGSGTRQALERFERDKKLPVTGALGPRTARQLASLSGIAIE